MDENTKTEEKKSSFPLIALIIVIIIIVVGYFMWPKGKKTSSEINNYGENATSTIPVINNSTSTTTSITTNSMHTVTIETTKGTIVFETYDADAPKASKNFVDLAGKGYYNGVIFHRVIPQFMIQGGDPTGTGRGGPGYSFEDELNPSTESYKKGYLRGTVAMANSGPNTNGSQFFIMHADYPLPNNYTIFGRVIKGMEVVDAIAASETDAADKPLQDIKMVKVTAVKK